MSYHKFYFLNKIIKNGEINSNDIYEYSKYYDILDREKFIYHKEYLRGLKEKELNYYFCKNIKIKYTKEKVMFHY